jgi:glycosyltransferase involved in cell wall biosynthesis
VASAGGGVTVIVPTFNRAALLRRTLASVLAQTVAPLEVLVADDGSTDDTPALLREFAPRVVHLALPHRGMPAPARNAALARARGDWVAFVDDDDLWHADKLERQLALAAADAALVCSNAELIDGADAPRGGCLHESHPLAKESDPLRALIGGNFVVCSSVLARTALLRAAGGFCEDPAVRGTEDYDLWLRCALRGPIRYEHAPRVRYRVSAHGNLSLAAPLRHVEALAAVRARFIAAAGPRAHGDLAEPLRRNWRRLQHARYKALAAEGRWWQALGPWTSVQLAKLRGRR